MRRLTESEIEKEGLRFEDWEAGLFSWNWDDNHKPVRFFFSPACIEEWKPKDDQWWARVERIIMSPHNESK
jgi:hypothetical protein